jgi:hypothetical protein
MNRSLEEKVRRAADRYRHKYGRMPNLCLINPSLAVGAEIGNPVSSDLSTVDEIELRTAPNILPHHFWLGTAEAGNGKG